MGKVPLSMLTDEHMTEYRKRAEKIGYSPKTTEKLLIDVRTIVKAATGVMLMPGRKCRLSFDASKLMIAGAKYLLEGGLKSKQLTSNCRAFFNETKSILGDIDPAEVTTDHFVLYRKLAMERGLSKVTIEKRITDVMTVCRYVSGTLPNSGRRLKRQRPTPTPSPLESIEKIFLNVDEWFQQWLVLTTWTGVRLTDSILMQIQLRKTDISSEEFISFQATKTGKHHIWPIPDWLRPWLKPTGKLPYRCSTEWETKILRERLAVGCEKAGVPVFTPKNIRQRAVSQWTRANGAAGAIIHGKSLGVMDSYVDQSQLLLETMPRVVMPDAFKLKAGLTTAQTSVPDDPFEMFSQMDANSRSILTRMMRAMMAPGD